MGGLVGAIGGKHIAGLRLGDVKWFVGWAMTCRAEFAYMVAQVCYWKGMMSEKMFGITLWSLFWATLAGPIGYHMALKKLKQTDSESLHHEMQDARIGGGQKRYDGQQSVMISEKDIESGDPIESRPSIESSKASIEMSKMGVEAANMAGEFVCYENNFVDELGGKKHAKKISRVVVQNG